MPQPKEAIEVSYHAFYLNPESFKKDLATILPGWELLPRESWMRSEGWIRYLSRIIPPSNKLSLALGPPRRADYAGFVHFTSSSPIEISISLTDVTKVQIRPDIERPQLSFTNNEGALLLFTRIPQGGIRVSPYEFGYSRQSRQDTSTSIRIQYS